MAKPLLYRPPPRWHLWAALGGAAVIHLGAVVAAMKREPPPVDLSDIPTAVVEATMEAPPEPTPPPQEVPVATPPPEAPETKPEYVEARPPPPRQPRTVRVVPIKAPGTMSISSPNDVATYPTCQPYPWS